MPDNITFKPATDVRRDDIVETFNVGYADYFVPMQFTGATFNAFIIRESINLGVSVIALLEEQAIALGLMAVREPYGWIGTVAVRPEYRRQGMARQIMKYLIERAHELKLERLQLEVLTRNEGAYKLYQELGFETQRRLLILAREPTENAESPDANGLIISREDGSKTLPLLEPLQDMPRNWQRQAESLEPSTDLAEGLVVREEEDGDPLGVILFNSQPSQVRLADFVFTQPAIGELLLAELIARFPTSHMSFVNVGEDETAVPILMNAGFTESLAQYEMYLPLL